MKMGKGSHERSDSSNKSESAPEGMPKGETDKKGDAGGQVASYAGTLMENVEKGSGSRDPTLQKAIDESAKARRAEIEKREKAQQEKEMGEAIYQSMIELSKKDTEKEMQNTPLPGGRGGTGSEGYIPHAAQEGETRACPDPQPAVRCSARARR